MMIDPSIAPGIDPVTFWTTTILLGLGTFLIRYSFLGFMGNRALPDWATRHLKYVGVAVLPALVTPMVLGEALAGGALDVTAIDPVRLAAALVALGLGWRFSVVWAIAGGMGTLWLGQALV